MDAGVESRTQRGVWKDVEERNTTLVTAIMMRYKEAGDPGVHKKGDELKPKKDGGDQERQKGRS